MTRRHPAETGNWTPYNITPLWDCKPTFDRLGTQRPPVSPSMSTVQQNYYTRAEVINGTEPQNVPSWDPLLRRLPREGEIKKKR